MKPVILLAFANAPADGANYLRNLPEEERRIRAALEYAEAQGLCEFEVRSNATLDDILGAFQQPKLRGRIAVFHYGGHADSYDLLFQSRPGDLQRIDARGFAAFLAEQRSLQLVFLNACSTEPQIEGLLGANVQAVIATAQDVDDGVAAELAGRFYAELAHGASIGASYRQAVAALRAQKGDDPNAFYAANALALAPGADGQAVETPVGVEAGGGASGGFWPWLLRTRRGGEAAIEWSLPLAAGDPLFGLPPLPPKPLPDSPYQRALDYYTRDLAELFFGRGRQIRDLYQRVTAPGRSGVILYYGQSGVGKSSLLDAGLAPRLAATHAVLYARRDRDLGLLGTLHKQLVDPAAAPDGAQASSSAPTPTDPPALLQAWLAAERRSGKPVVLILDQVEEVFSRRNPDQPQELEELAAALGAIDRTGSDASGPVGQGRPAGVLLLGFRKERLAEVETTLRNARVDFAKLFLEPLDVGGIQEVFWGPVRNGRLRDKYGLTVEDSLPEIVAHDLTADPDSPVAPTLNILLRKLWAAATAQAASAPHFTVALYEHLRRDGILLDDFLRQQTATLTQEQPDAVTSGLLLDLWAFHTTPLGTSDQHDAAELKAAYGERPSVEALVLRSKELYVLADPAGDSAGAGGGSRLAHDTLAPLVRRDFATSTLPGQQARRLLESRAVDWQDGRSGPLLDDAALAVLDKGLAGMRGLSEPEQRLIAASKTAQAARVRRQRLSRGAAAAAVLVVLALLAATFLSWDNGRLQSERADRAAAESQAAQARAEREAAERQAAEERSRASQLSSQLANERERAAAAEAQRNESQRLAELAEQQLAVDPVVSLQLALAALPSGPDAPSVPEAEYTLRQAVLASRERAFITTTLDGPEAVAMRGSRVAVGGAQPAVYTLDLSAENFLLPPDFTDVLGLHWGDDGRLLGWSENTAWALGGGEPQRFVLPTPANEAGGDQIRCAEWQPAQRWVAICTYNALYAWQPDSGRVITVTTEIDTPDAPTERRGAAWSPDGRLLAGSGGRLAVWDSSQPQTPAQVYDEAPEPGSSVSFAFWLPEDGGGIGGNGGSSLLAGWFGPAAQGLHTVRWRAGAAELEPVTLEPDVSGHVQVQALDAPDATTGAARLLLWSNDGLLALYTADGRQVAAAEVGGAGLNGVALTPGGRMVAAYAGDGSAAVYAVDDLHMIVRLDAANGFSADALTGATWLDDRTLLLADRSGLLQMVNLDANAAGSGAADVAVTRLPGYGRGERLAAADRVAGGRLLTAGYVGGGGPSSLRLWQAELVTEPATAAEAAAATAAEAAAKPALPPPSEPLCLRVQRGLPLPQGLSWPSALTWGAGDHLLVANDDGSVAQWTLGGGVAPLPPDDTRTQVVFAPGYTRLLRYDVGTDGQLWRWTGEGWVQEGSVAGSIAAAVWSRHGLLIQFEDGSGVLLDPDNGERRALPEGTQLEGSTLVAADFLVALRGGSVELWQIGGEQPLSSWPVPADRLLQLTDIASDGSLLVYQDGQWGQVYVLRFEAAARTLDEVWRSDEFHVNPGPARLSPLLPLLASINDGALVLVDLDGGSALWSSRGAAPVAGQEFQAVQWSTDGQYLITQAQPPQASSLERRIDVWRWNGQQGAPVLLQAVQAANLVGVRPDMQWLLASEGGPPGRTRVAAVPIFTDIAQLREEAPASCLLVRPLSAAQRQAFLIDGR